MYPSKKAASIRSYITSINILFIFFPYSTTAIRTGKPFNPLLGETFEMDRSDDLGFRLISEQVSHHPPMLAMHAECSQGKWKTWQGIFT